jgi:lysophospholipase L1-like esterase
MSLVRLAAVLMIAFIAVPAQAQVPCGPFTTTPLASPAPRVNKYPVDIFERINEAVKTQPYRVMFLGDSITERWDAPLWNAKTVWDANMAPRSVLDAGVSGDRTEHLLWRLDHGNLDGPVPKGIVLLIGTNDLGHGRPPEEAAEGIRAVLLRLREKLPATRILLLGLTPRGATPNDPLRQLVVEVNKLIPRCADGKTIVYADIGGVLLDRGGVLSRTVSPDLLHFNGAGYERLAPKLDQLIDQLVGPP